VWLELVQILRNEKYVMAFVWADIDLDFRDLLQKKRIFRPCYRFRGIESKVILMADNNELPDAPLLDILDELEVFGGVLG
jgi:hypothetical protein